MDHTPATWTAALLPFGAGFSLRTTVAFIQSRLRREFGLPTLPSRAIPLTTIRGLDAEAIERLEEEGITNVARLAWASPFRLLRSTTFDRRQLMSWISEAMLILYFPTGWEKVQEVGFAGIIDLVRYRRVKDDLLAPLAEALNIDSAALKARIEQLAGDAQVRLVWALYQAEGWPGTDDTPPEAKVVTPPMEDEEPEETAVQATNGHGSI